MSFTEQAVQHPLPINSEVVVHGQRGRILGFDAVGGGRYRYQILLLQVGEVKRWLCPPTEVSPWLGPVDIALSGKLSPTLDYDLKTEAFRLSLAYEYDRMVSLSSSRVNLEPYQVEAVHQVANSFPHRYLIADEPGLGKTIEAGMMMEELAIRGRADRVLILAPKPVCRQWKNELRNGFNRDYIIYDGPYLSQLAEKLAPEQNPWERDSKIIVSLDLAKRDDIRAQLERTRWDLVIFDEAHKLSVKQYGARVEETQRYKLGKVLAEKSDGLLLLSGTPHNGEPYTFNALLALIDEFAFPDPDLLDPKHVAKVTIRRGKKEILNEEGLPVFVPRDVRTVPVEFSDQELALYEAVTRYIIEGFNLAAADAKNRAIGFVMVLFQKRMVSSIEAIRRSLRRRRNRLQDALTTSEATGPGVSLTREELRKLQELQEDPDSLDDKERQELEERLEGVVATLQRKVLEREIAQLNSLCDQADEVLVDSKGDALLEFLRGILEGDQEERVLVFTEYTDTLEYLEQRIKEAPWFKRRGWTVCTVHGGMGDDEREEQLKVFQQPKTKVMVATDAAGEGLNLHWGCHLMINYELPWNPNRIEQRIGRLHRYGQRRDIHVYNLFVTNTREDQILDKLLERIARIGRDLPGDPYDVLGALLEEVNITDLVMSALARGEEPEVTAEKAARAAEERARMLQRIDKELFQEVRRYDHQRSLQVLRRVQSASATNEDLRRFAEAFLISYGTRITRTRKEGVVRLRDLPSVVAREGVKPAYDAITFDRQIAQQSRPDEVEFVAFGHPLFDAIVSCCTAEDTNIGGLATSKIVHEQEMAGRCGVVFNFRLRFTDGRGATGNEELISIFVCEQGAVETDVAQRIPHFEDNARQEPILTGGHRRLLDKLSELYRSAWDAAASRSQGEEDAVQERRLITVEAMKQDLDRYASARESRLKMQQMAIEERVREYRRQPQLFPVGQDIRILGEEARLRVIDTDLERLRQRVANRREELGNMDIILAEKPELISLALVEFVP